MAARLILAKPTDAELQELLAAHESYIKLAVDIARGKVAGGGEWHSDAEELLLADGSKQDDIWGGDWLPATQEVEFESMINIRPILGNRSRDILDSEIRNKFEGIVRDTFQSD